jgi:isoleucyl-tRNA synthetase
MTQPSDTFSFPDNELKILEFWRSHNTFQKSLDKTAQGPVYAFYDGPPFATGLPHHGHLLASTIKDIIPRYFTMNGYFVERRFGWDCHGLPIEYEIDKQFGKTTAEIVEEKGISAYNQACRNIVQRYATEWRSTVERIGRWVDFDNDYKTMNPDFMESVWWVFKQLWNKGLIYQGTKVVPYSTALGTGLSNFEAGSNYQDVQDPAITVLFKLTSEPHHLAVWTTTPWTLPSNLGICVNANVEYLLVEAPELKKTFYIAKERLADLQKHHQLNPLSQHMGSELVNKTYHPLFEYFAQLESEGAFRVLADDYVTTEDGTGLVHMAPAFGEDDARVMKAADINAQVCPIDNAGCFTDVIEDYKRMYVKDADKRIIRDLKKRGNLLHQETIQHSYPFCPRSDTPLIYRAIPSWYVNVERIKDQLIQNNEQINWIPGHIKHGRFGKWLENARDWAISRNRVWGTPLPVWKNSVSGQCICVGSIDELEELSGVRVTDLHRDVVDSIVFTRPDEEGSYHRISEVLDCWFESGSMPYAQKHYPFKNKAQFEQGYPAEFIAEGLDQTRGWFYTLTVLATALFDQPAFKNVIVNGIVMAEDGKKMSKRLRNYTAPDELMQRFGADALRLYLINSGLVKAEEQRFSDEGVKDMVRRTLLPWHNAFKFLHTYASVDQWQPDSKHATELQILDRWILSRCHSLKALIHQHMQGYKLYLVVPELLLFIDDLTNMYIRLNRSRFWSETMTADKAAAFSTLFQVITEFSQCMAPFAPFLAETVYQELLGLYANPNTQPESVHLCDYPQADATAIVPELEQAASRLKQILILGRQRRGELKIKTKTPLSRLTIIHKDLNLLNEIKKLESIIQQELNVKTIEYAQNESDYINLYAKPNAPRLGQRLQKRFGQFRGLIQALNHDDIEALESGKSITLENETFTQEDVLIFREAKSGTETITNRYISIVLDGTLTEALIHEGMAREVVNRIQKTRKDLNLNVSDRIHITFDVNANLKRIIETHQAYIFQETLCLQHEFKPLTDSDFSESVEGYELALSIERVESTTSS